MRQLSLLAATAACVVLAAPPMPAHAADPALPCVKGESESKGRSAVDDGEIRWTDKTSYDDARKFAMAGWQYGGSKIRFAPDEALTVNDLEFRDGDLGNRDSDPLGVYTWNGGPGATDYVTFNRQKLKHVDQDKLRHVALHELGHALGLCHKPDGKYATLMWRNILVAMAAPKSSDKANYKKLWGQG